MLELSSNTIKVLGTFGRLSPEQEALFDNLEAKYSNKPDESQGYDIIRHFSLTFIMDALVSDIPKQLDLLHELKQFLPYKIKVNKFFVKEEESPPGAEHIAAEFDLGQTKDLIDFIKSKVGNEVVETRYMKLVWFVPKENQQKVINELAQFTTLEFTDFYLVSNKQNEDNTLFTTTSFTK